jgi:hypothetical protein
MYQFIPYHIPEDNLHEYSCDNLESRKISEKLPTYPRGDEHNFRAFGHNFIKLEICSFFTCTLHYKYLINFTLLFLENVSDPIEKVIVHPESL